VPVLVLVLVFVYFWMPLHGELPPDQQRKVRKETGHTHKHTTPTPPHNTRHDKNNTTDDHTKNHPPALHNDRRWRGDGAYHLPGKAIYLV